MYEFIIKELEGEKRHFTICAYLALALMLFMWVSSYMEYAQGEHVSMRTIAYISAGFLFAFIVMIRRCSKKISKTKQDAMAEPWIKWFNE